MYFLKNILIVHSEAAAHSPSSEYALFHVPLIIMLWPQQDPWL